MLTKLAKKTAVKIFLIGIFSIHTFLDILLFFYPANAFALTGTVLPTTTASPSNNVLTVTAEPQAASLAGINQGNIPNFETSFNLSALPIDAVVTAASLSFTQSGTSNDFIKLVNKYDNMIIDSKSLAAAGNITSSRFTDIAQRWVDLPGNNLGILFQSNGGLGADDRINFSAITLAVAYYLPDKTPPAINKIEVSEITKNSAVITVETNEEATALLVYGKTSAYGSKLSAGNLAFKQQFTLSGLADGTTYHFQITSTDASNNKTVSPDRQFITLLDQKLILGANQIIVDATQINPPSDLKLVLGENGEQNYADLSWTASRTLDISGYVIYRSVDNRENFMQYRLTDNNTTKFSDLQTAPEHTYFYFVRAYKNNSLSDKTNEEAIYLQKYEPQVAGISTDQASPQKILLILGAFTGLILCIYYVFFKGIEKFLERRKNLQGKKSLKNVLRDPDFYS